MEREWGSAKANTTWCILRCFWKRQRAEIQHLQSILWNNGPNSQTVDLAVDQGIRQNRDSYCQPKKHQLMQLFCTHWHTQYLSKYQSPPKSVLWEYDPLVMEYVLSHQTFTFDLHSCLSYPIVVWTRSMTPVNDKYARIFVIDHQSMTFMRAYLSLTAVNDKNARIFVIDHGQWQ